MAQAQDTYSKNSHLVFLACTGNVFSCHEKSPEAQLERSALLINPGPQEYWLTTVLWLCDPHKTNGRSVIDAL